MNLKEFLCSVKIFEILKYVPNELKGCFKDKRDLDIS